MTFPALECFTFKGTGVYRAARANPSQAHVVAGSLSRKGIFQHLKKKVFVRKSRTKKRHTEASWVRASLEGQLFLMKKVKTIKRSRWFLEEKGFI